MLNPRTATRVILAAAMAFVILMFLATVSAHGAMCPDSLKRYERTDFIKQAQWSSTRKMLLSARQRSTGGWTDAYTGKVIRGADSVDVDHVVALAYAFRIGACQWSTAQKRMFANDSVNLLLTRDSINTSKSDKSVSGWLPPRNACAFVRRWLSVTRKYGLAPTQQDSVVLRNCKLVK